jgi:hypothetical protein
MHVTECFVKSDIICDEVVWDVRELTTTHHSGIVLNQTSVRV